MNDEVSSPTQEGPTEFSRSQEEARLRLEALQIAYQQLMQKLLADGQKSVAAIEQTNADIEQAKEYSLAKIEDLRNEARSAACEQGLEDGRKQGFEAGHAEGVQMGLEEGRREFSQSVEQKARELVSQQCETLPQTLATAIEEFSRCWKDTIEETRRDTVKLARGIAQRILRREIEDLPSVVVENIELAVQRIGDRSQIVVEVNPADLTAVVKFLPILGQKFEGAEGAEIVGEESITRGGCRVRSRSASVDLTMETQLDLIESALIKDTQEN